MQSLKDKLLKAGVVNDADIKRAEAPKARPPEAAPEEKLSGHRAPASARRHDERPPAARPPSAPRTPESRLPKFAPLQGSAAANREASRKQHQLDKQVRDLVLAGTVPLDDGATVFFYTTRKNKLRRLLITEPQAERLRRGEIAIAERPDPAQIEHQLVTAETAEALLKLSDKAVRFFNRPGQAVGFLSDEEIQKRAAESEAAGSAAAGEPAASDSVSPTSSAAAEPETWVTIKRAPSGDA